MPTYILIGHSYLYSKVLQQKYYYIIHNVVSEHYCVKQVLNNAIQLSSKDNTTTTLDPCPPFPPFTLLSFSTVSKLTANRTRAAHHTTNLLIAQSCIIWAWHCGASESPGCEMRQAAMKSSGPQYALNKHQVHETNAWKVFMNPASITKFRHKYSWMQMCLYLALLPSSEHTFMQGQAHGQKKAA